MSAIVTAIRRHPRHVRLPAWQGRGGSPLLRLVAFGAMAGFAAGHWSALVADAPAGRMTLVVLVAVGVGAALAGLGSVGLPPVAVHVAALVVLVAGVVLAVGAVGLPVVLLDPRHWGELASDLDRGLAGIRTVDWPYSGPEPMVRLAILLGAPALLVPAAALAFWPARRGAATALRCSALALLLVLYGVAVTEHDQGGPLGRGLALLALVAAWLWMPRLRLREAAGAALVVLVVGLAAMPVAAKLDSDGPLIDYRGWNWFGGQDVMFDWDHSYGPLDWPRDGSTLLNVTADRPLYWKVQTLDTFDGLRWLRSSSSDNTNFSGELPAVRDARFDEEFRVTVRSLRTDFVIGAGTPYAVEGAGQAVAGSADGTWRKLDESLTRGDSYIVRAYVPDPGPAQLRTASDDYRPGFGQYTRLLLPERGATALSAEAAERPGEAVQMPLWASRRSHAAADRALAVSPYARTFRLSRRLTRDAPTAYAAVKRIERYLARGDFTYSERPPTRPYPLEGFLVDDKIGYCQQFSGAMALMLRMSGIPARVVSGFSPGTRDDDDGEFKVRDLDAHSWVEVYFPDIGWVTFDPTPSTSPAVRGAGGPGGGEGNDREGAATLGNGSGDGPSVSSPRASDDSSARGRVASDGGELGLWVVPLAFLGLGMMAVAGAVAVRRVALGRLPPQRASDAALRELRRALPRLGWSLTSQDTLLTIEQRLRRGAGPSAARYVERLRNGRFSARAAHPPTPAERRMVRRELTSGRGPRARLRSVFAFPPGGPRLRS